MNLHDVEDILDSWESTGLLQDHPDRFNLALCLDTQRRVNEKIDCPTQFRRVSLPAVINIIRQKPDMFQGLVETTDCTDVFRLGFMPRGNDADVCATLVVQVLNLNLEGRYFAGLTYKNGIVYLVTGQDE